MALYIQNVWYHPEIFIDVTNVTTEKHYELDDTYCSFLGSEWLLFWINRFNEDI